MQILIGAKNIIMNCVTYFLDTEAGPSLIKKISCQLIDCQKRYNQSPKPFYSASRTLLKTLRKLTAYLQIGDTTVRTPFSVFDSLAIDMLPVTSFFDEHILAVPIEEGKVTVATIVQFL